MVPGSVVIGYCDDGHWSACFGISLRNLYLYDLAHDQHVIGNPASLELRQLSGTMGVAAGRNQIVKSFLDRSRGEWLWMVDTDMGFGDDTVERLLAAAHPVHKPVVGGLCFAMKRAKRAMFNAERYRISPTVYEYLELDTEVGFRPIKDYPRGETVQVAGTGAACLLMHRSALDAVRKMYGDRWFEPIVHPTGDNGQPRGFSEDLSFCIRLAATGLPIYVDTSVKTTHEKGGIFLDEETFDLQPDYGTEQVPA